MSRILVDGDITTLDISFVPVWELDELMFKAPKPWPLDISFIPSSCEHCNRRLSQCECDQKDNQ